MTSAATFLEVGKSPAKREDGRKSPSEVLGFLSGVRHREEELRRAFFSGRFSRTLDSLGYTRFRHWRLYGEEALPGREATVWLQPGSLTLEYGGETLSTDDVEISRETGKLTAVGDARLFGTAYVLPQLRLFALDDSEWLKAMKLGGYAPPVRTHAFAGSPVPLPRRPVTVAS